MEALLDQHGKTGGITDGASRMTAEMMAAAYYRGNKTFTVQTAEKIAPGPEEATIRIAYCGICGTDMHIYHGHMDARVGDNRVIGHEMSGVIESLGAGVTDFAVGQKVVVRPLDHCGECPACKAGHSHICHNLKVLGIDTQGAMQAFWTVPARTLHALPDALRLDHAALIEPLAVACHDVRLSALNEGEDVLVIGGGPIGILVAMVARDAGGRVTISEFNESRIAIAEKLGFETVNPIKTDLVAAINAKTDDKGADVAFEVSGTQAGVDAMTSVMATRGRIVMVAIHATKPNVDLFQFFWRELKLLGARVYEPQDYEKAIGLISNGRIACDTIITDVSPLDDVQAAFEALDNSPNAMKTLIKVGDLP